MVVMKTLNKGKGRRHCRCLALKSLERCEQEAFRRVGA